MTNLDSVLKSRDTTLLTKFHLVKAMVFAVVMHRCESWTIKKFECWRTDALELWCWRRLLIIPWTARRATSHLHRKSNLHVHWKDWYWSSSIWTPDEKSQFTGKHPDIGKDWWQEEKETTEGEMVGWHRRLDGHDVEQALRVCDGQGSLACCSPWGHKESDTTEQLN